MDQQKLIVTLTININSTDKAREYEIYNLSLWIAFPFWQTSIYADDENMEQAFIEAQALFEQSLRGDESVTDQAYEKFATLVGLHPEKPEFLVYWGSSQALQARDTWMPWTSLKLAEGGLIKIDKALSMLEIKHDQQKVRGSIISMEIRLVAISTFLKVPNFLNRFQPAKQLFTDTTQHSAFNKASDEVRSRIYFLGAKIACRQDNIIQERDYIMTGLSIHSQTYQAEQARIRLQDIDEGRKK